MCVCVYYIKNDPNVSFKTYKHTYIPTYSYKHTRKTNTHLHIHTQKNYFN